MLYIEDKQAQVNMDKHWQVTEGYWDDTTQELLNF